MVVALFRTSAAVWGALIVIPLTLYFLSGVIIGSVDPYVVAITARATEAFFVIASISAAVAAWEGGRAQCSGWHTLPHVRHPVQIVSFLLLPVGILTLSALAIAFTYTLWRSGVPPIPDTRIVIMSIVLVLAYVLLGFAIGVVVPPAISVPSVLIGTYLLTTTPSVFGPTWSGHLEGDLSGCCGIDESLAPRALIAPMIYAIGLVGTGMLLLRPRMALVGKVLAVTPVLLAVALAGFIARDVGEEPIRPRMSAMSCAPGPPRVCVWPEHDERLDEVASLAAEASQAWRNAGLNPPAEFSERKRSVLSTESNDARSFGVWSGADRMAILAALSYSMLPEIPGCAYGQQQPYPDGMAWEYVDAYLSATAGLPRQQLLQRFGGPRGPSILATIDEVRSLPPAEQKDWFERNSAAIGQCDVEPPIDPNA